MAIRRASKSSISTTSSGKRFNLIAGYSPAVDEMDLIERVTVGAGGVSSIVLGSGNTIPQTYKHLHIRMVTRATNASEFVGPRGRINGVTTSSYSRHQMYTDGLGVSAIGQSGSEMYLSTSAGGNAAANMFGSAIVDILDYANTTKRPVLRVFGGSEQNGNGYLHLDGGMLDVVGAVTSITLFPSAGNWAENTTISLYGVIG